MSSFDDANVDKDLLSQIFADEGENDDAETDALLGELLKEAEEADKSSGSDDLFSGMTEEKTISEVVEDEKAEQAAMDTAKEAPEEVPAEVPAEETPAEIPVPEASVAEAPAETMAAEAPVAEAPAEAPVAVPAEASTVAAGQSSDKDVVLNEAMEKIEADRKSGNTTTITSGTEINGSISSNGSLEVCGMIQGDIDCRGMVCVIGQVTGDIIASEIYVSTSKRMSGDLSSEGAIKVGEGTKVMGNVNATSAYIAGAVKGNIDVNGHVEVDSTAIIRGDINAKSIQVNSGAVVDGKMSLNYAGVDLDSFFEE